MGVLRYLMVVLDIFYGCPENFSFVSWRYLMGALKIFDGCPEEI